MGIRMLMEKTCDNCGNLRVVEPKATWGYSGNVVVTDANGGRNPRQWFACGRACIEGAVVAIYHGVKGYKER